MGLKVRKARKFTELHKICHVGGESISKDSLVVSRNESKPERYDTLEMIQSTKPKQSGRMKDLFYVMNTLEFNTELSNQETSPMKPALSKPRYFKPKRQQEGVVVLKGKTLLHAPFFERTLDRHFQQRQRYALEGLSLQLNKVSTQFQ